MGKSLLTWEKRVCAMFLSMKRHYQLCLLILPAVIIVAVFNYAPMYGVIIAFNDFRPSLGILGSEGVGLKWFQRFFEQYNFWDLMKNTLGISLYDLALGFPFPIILAIMINEVRQVRFRKTVQMITYIPYFISVVAISGMIVMFLKPDTGLVNHIVAAFGGERKDFLSDPAWFKTIYVVSNLWQNIGWNTIIFIAALAGVSPDLYDAAYVDGTSRIQKILHVDLPCIVPTIMTMLILRCGQIMSVGFEKILLMQNQLNMTSSDVISTYVYRLGLVGAQYSYATAIGLFNSLINFIILILVNRISKRLTETNIW